MGFPNKKIYICVLESTFITSVFVMYHSLLSKETKNIVCYKCGLTTGPFVQPCDTNDCKGCVHQECLAILVAEGDDKCKECQQPVIQSNTTKFDGNLFCDNTLLFCDNTLLLFTRFVLSVFGTIVPGLFIMGTTLSEGFVRVNVGWVFGAVGSIMLIVISGFMYTVYLYIFSDVVPNCWNNILSKCNVGENYRGLCSCFAILVIEYTTIGVCHLLGFLVLKYMFNAGNIFSYQSFITGILVMACIIVALFVIVVAVRGAKYTYRQNSKEVITFGKKLEV